MKTTSLSSRRYKNVQKQNLGSRAGDSKNQSIKYTNESTNPSRQIYSNKKEFKSPEQLSNKDQAVNIREVKNTKPITKLKKNINTRYGPDNAKNENIVIEINDSSRIYRPNSRYHNKISGDSLGKTKPGLKTITKSSNIKLNPEAIEITKSVESYKTEPNIMQKVNQSYLTTQPKEINQLAQSHPTFQIIRIPSPNRSEPARGNNTEIYNYNYNLVDVNPEKGRDLNKPSDLTPTKEEVIRENLSSNKVKNNNNVKQKIKFGNKGSPNKGNVAFLESKPDEPHHSPSKENLFTPIKDNPKQKENIYQSSNKKDLSSSIKSKDPQEGKRNLPKFQAQKKYFPAHQPYEIKPDYKYDTNQSVEQTPESACTHINKYLNNDKNKNNKSNKNNNKNNNISTSNNKIGNNTKSNDSNIQIKSPTKSASKEVLSPEELQKKLKDSFIKLKHNTLREDKENENKQEETKPNKENDEKYAQWFDRNCDNNNVPKSSKLSKNQIFEKWLGNNNRDYLARYNEEETPYEEWFDKHAETEENKKNKEKEKNDKEEKKKASLNELLNIIGESKNDNQNNTNRCNNPYYNGLQYRGENLKKVEKILGNFNQEEKDESIKFLKEHADNPKKQKQIAKMEENLKENERVKKQQNLIKKIKEKNDPSNEDIENVNEILNLWNAESINNDKKNQEPINNTNNSYEELYKGKPTKQQILNILNDTNKSAYPNKDGVLRNIGNILAKYKDNERNDIMDYLDKNYGTNKNKKKELANLNNYIRHQKQQEALKRLVTLSEKKLNKESNSDNENEFEKEEDESTNKTEKEERMSELLQALPPETKAEVLNYIKDELKENPNEKQNEFVYKSIKPKEFENIQNLNKKDEEKDNDSMSIYDKLFALPLDIDLFLPAREENIYGCVGLNQRQEPKNLSEETFNDFINEFTSDLFKDIDDDVEKALDKKYKLQITYSHKKNNASKPKDSFDIKEDLPLTQQLGHEEKNLTNSALKMKSLSLPDQVKALNLIKKLCDNQKLRNRYEKLGKKLRQIENTQSLIKQMINKQKVDKEKKNYMDNVAKNIVQEMFDDKKINEYIPEDDFIKQENKTIKKTADTLLKMTEDDRENILSILNNASKDSDAKKEKLKKLKILLRTMMSRAKGKENGDLKGSFRIGKLNTERKEKDKVINEKIDKEQIQSCHEEDLDKDKYKELLNNFEKDLFGSNKCKDNINLNINDNTNNNDNKKTKKNIREKQLKTISLIEKIAKVIKDMNDKDNEKTIQKLKDDCQSQDELLIVDKLSKLVNDMANIKKILNRIYQIEKIKKDCKEYKKHERQRDMTESELKQLVNEIYEDISKSNNDISNNNNNNNDDASISEVDEIIEEAKLDKLAEIINNLRDSEKEFLMNCLKTKIFDEENAKIYNRLVIKVSRLDGMQKFIKDYVNRKSKDEEKKTIYLYNKNNNNNLKCKNTNDNNKNNSDIQKLSEQELFDLADCFIDDLFKDDKIPVNKISDLLNQNDKDDKINEISDIIKNNLVPEDKEKMLMILNLKADDLNKKKIVKKINDNLRSDIPTTNAIENEILLDSVNDLNNNDENKKEINELKDEQIVELAKRLIDILYTNFKYNHCCKRMNNLNIASNLIKELKPNDQQKIYEIINENQELDKECGSDEQQDLVKNKKIYLNNLKDLTNLLTKFMNYLNTLPKNPKRAPRKLEKNKINGLADDILNDLFKYDDILEGKLDSINNELSYEEEEKLLQKNVDKIKNIDRNDQKEILNILKRKIITSDENSLLKRFGFLLFHDNLMHDYETAVEDSKNVVTNKNDLANKVNKAKAIYKAFTKDNKDKKDNEDNKNKYQTENYLDSKLNNEKDLKAELLKMGKNYIEGKKTSPDELYNFLLGDDKTEQIYEGKLSIEEIDNLTTCFITDLFNKENNKTLIKNSIQNLIKELSLPDINNIYKALLKKLDNPYQKALINEMMNNIYKYKKYKDEANKLNKALGEEDKNIKVLDNILGKGNNNKEGKKSLKVLNEKSNEIIDGIINDLLNYNSLIPNDDKKELVNDSVKPKVDDDIKILLKLPIESQEQFISKYKDKINNLPNEDLKNNNNETLAQIQSALESANKLHQLKQDTLQELNQRPQKVDQKLPKLTEELPIKDRKNLYLTTMGSLYYDIDPTTEEDDAKKEDLETKSIPLKYIDDKKNDKKLKNIVENIESLTDPDKQKVLNFLNKAADNNEKEIKYNNLLQNINKLEEDEEFYKTLNERNEALKNKKNEDKDKEENKEKVKNIENIEDLEKVDYINNVDNVDNKDNKDLNKLNDLSDQIYNYLTNDNSKLPTDSKIKNVADALSKFDNNLKDKILNNLENKASKDTNENNKNIINKLSEEIANKTNDPNNKINNINNILKDKQIANDVEDNLLKETNKKFISNKNISELNKREYNIENIKDLDNKDIKKLIKYFENELFNSNNKYNANNNNNEIEKYLDKKRKEQKINEIADILSCLTNDDLNKIFSELEKKGKNDLDNIREKVAKAKVISEERKNKGLENVNSNKIKNFFKFLDESEAEQSPQMKSPLKEEDDKIKNIEPEENIVTSEKKEEANSNKKSEEIKDIKEEESTPVKEEKEANDTLEKGDSDSKKRKDVSEENEKEEGEDEEEDDNEEGAEDEIQ